MTALDIAGAVVWTPLALLFWMALFLPARRDDPEENGLLFIAAAAFSLASVYCIARLFGAAP